MNHYLNKFNLTNVVCLLSMCCLLNCRIGQETGSHAGSTIPAQRADSGTAGMQVTTKAHRPAASLRAFYESLIDQRSLEIDTSWYSNLDRDEQVEDQYLQLPRYGDYPDTFIAFPFSDLAMTYNNPGHRDGSGYFFRIGNTRIPEQQYKGDNRFPVASIHRFRYLGKPYMVFSGGLIDFTGHGGRIHFDYFFDLSGRQPVADMRDNCWGFIDEPFLYGVLNTGAPLSRIRFDGVCYPLLTGPDTITVTAESYQYRKWKPLKEPGGKAYFIQLLANDADSFWLGNAHWMKPFHVP